MSVAEQTPGPEVTRVDRDHWPAHMDGHPELFVKSVREFLAGHPAEQWECRISMHGYLVRLTAVKRTPAPNAHLLDALHKLDEAGRMIRVEARAAIAQAPAPSPLLSAPSQVGPA